MFPWDKPQNPFNNMALSLTNQKRQQNLEERQNQFSKDRQQMKNTQNNQILGNKSQILNIEDHAQIQNHSDTTANRMQIEKKNNQFNFQVQNLMNPSTQNQEQQAPPIKIEVYPQQNQKEKYTNPQMIQNNSIVVDNFPQVKQITNNSLMVPSMNTERNNSKDKAKYAEDLNQLVYHSQSRRQAARNQQKEEDQKLQAEYDKYQPYGQDHIRLLKNVTDHIMRPQTQIQNDQRHDYPYPIQNQPLDNGRPIQTRGHQMSTPYVPQMQNASMMYNPQMQNAPMQNLSMQNDYMQNANMQNAPMQNTSMPAQRYQEEMYNPSQANQHEQLDHSGYYDSTSNNQIQYQSDNNYQNQGYLSVPQNNQSQRIPTISDLDSSRMIPEFVSTYDHTHSHLLKQEKSLLHKNLNQINDAYLKSLSDQYAGNQYPPQPQYISPPQPDIRHRTPMQQPQVFDNHSLTDRQRQEQDELKQKIQDQLQLIQEQQMELQRKNQQIPMNVVQTQTMESDGLYEAKMHEYVTSLKELSNQIIGMKNDYTHEQMKLNHHLITLRGQSLRDYEEKIKLQKHLLDLGQKQQASKVFEAERQIQLMQALAKNPPVQKYNESSLLMKNINPRVNKIVYFQDNTRGYEYDESQDVYYKSHMLPLQDSKIASQTEQILKESYLNHRDWDKAQHQNSTKLGYTTDTTKALKINDISQPFYDYSYNAQVGQPQKYRQEEFTQNQAGQFYGTQLDAENLLLENDRRLFELSKLGNNEEEELVKSIYQDSYF